MYILRFIKRGSIERESVLFLQADVSASVQSSSLFALLRMRMTSDEIHRSFLRSWEAATAVFFHANFRSLKLSFTEDGSAMVVCSLKLSFFIRRRGEKARKDDRG
ncbi:hypothetical protein U1Q18_028123 [Sarracenia purpurea var. burkii]